MGKNIRLHNFYSIIFLKLLFFITTFLFSVQLMVLSFKFLNADLIEHIIIATSNPFISLFIGLLITAMMQSSSTTTTMIVAVVASGTISLDNAVFMVMGANIGTTVTSTFVSLGHVTRKKEFRKAIAAATLHDFFNIFTALLLLPLEYYFGILSRLSLYISGFISVDLDTANLLWQSIGELFGPSSANLYLFIRQFDILSLLFSIFLLFVSLHFISRTFRQLLLDKNPSYLEKYALQSPVRALFIGTTVTGAVQSSSLVTSLIVPIVANNRLSIRNSFPFIMGANIGTTLTALIAAISESQAALSIAMAHLLFNIIGVLVFFPFKRLFDLPVRIARNLGKATLKNRMYGFVYVVLMFFVIPFFLIFFSRSNVHIKQYTCIQDNNVPKTQLAEFGANSSLPIRLIYKQLHFDNAFFFQNEPGNEIRVKRKEDTVYVNTHTFLLKQKGFCWQDQDRGQFTMCVDDIRQEFVVHPQLKVDSCYIFKKIYNSAADDSHTYFIHVDPITGLIIQREVFSASGDLLGREKLISIVHQ